jgi:hypothetical protein
MALLRSVFYSAFATKAVGLGIVDRYWARYDGTIFNPEEGSSRDLA